MITWSYVAGFFDGEGSISVRQAHVALYQSERKPLDAIEKFLKDHGVLCSVRERLTPRKTNFGVWDEGCSLQINGAKSMTRFLRAILPYLQTKKRIQVEDFLRFRIWCPPLTQAQCGFLGREVLDRGNRYRAKVSA